MWLRQPVTGTATEVSHKMQTSTNRSRVIFDFRGQQFPLTFEAPQFSKYIHMILL
jgi:hypothetical protein